MHRQHPFHRLFTTLLIGTFLSLPGAIRAQHSNSKINAATILTGADQMSSYLPLLKGANIAVFANQTAMVGKTHLVDTLLKAGIHIS